MAELHGGLDGLDPATLAMFRHLDSALRLGGSRLRIDDALLKKLSAGWGEADWRAMALWAQLLTRTTDGDIASHILLTTLARSKLRWTPRSGNRCGGPRSSCRSGTCSTPLTAVGVTSTGLDPRGHGDYWQSYGFGDLTESAQVRRDRLTRLLPRLTIADRCTLAGRFLLVQGDLRTYKIHLGSANILMEPNDAYLCIVPTGDPQAGLFLPFEEDGRLALILSKAFLLANDTAITDPSITYQLRV